MDREDAKMAGSTDQGPGNKAGRFLGSLRDALAAAGREETGGAIKHQPAPQPSSAAPPPLTALPQAPSPADAPTPAAATPDKASPPPLPSAAEVAREARAAQTRTAVARPERHVEYDAPPTTRVIRAGKPADKAAAPEPEDDEAARTQLVRGNAPVKREGFQQDPVVGWLVVVGGPGLGMYRPIFEGNNTIGRASSQRIPIDFGDTSISSEEQAYIRYDGVDRAFLFVPNLAKTNVVRVNDKKPTGAVPLASMDVITMGRTQLVFVAFCGVDFDWSELGEIKA